MNEEHPEPQANERHEDDDRRSGKDRRQGKRRARDTRVETERRKGDQRSGEDRRTPPAECRSEWPLVWFARSLRGRGAGGRA